MGDEEIALAARQALTLCANALEALPLPENSALHDLLEDAWRAVEKLERKLS